MTCTGPVHTHDRTRVYEVRTHWLNSTFCYCSDHDSGLDGKKGKARSVWMMLPMLGTVA